MHSCHSTDCAQNQACKTRVCHKSPDCALVTLPEQLLAQTSGRYIDMVLLVAAHLALAYCHYRRIAVEP